MFAFHFFRDRNKDTSYINPGYVTRECSCNFAKEFTNCTDNSAPVDVKFHLIAQSTLMSINVRSYKKSDKHLPKNILNYVIIKDIILRFSFKYKALLYN